jgi:hypothetical protein
MPPPKRLAPPARLTQPCETLPPLKTDTPSAADLLRNHLRVTRQYHLVCTRHEELSRWATPNDDAKR